MSGPATQPSGTPSIEGLPARRLSLQLLEEVLTRKQALDYSLENLHGLDVLSGRDRGFVRMLVATTLRRLGQIDDIIEKALDRPDSLKNPTLHHILRMGVTQILFMDVPDHAAVDTAVRLAEENGMGSHKGFVNAVLRTMTRSGKEWLSRQDPARLNTPEWLLKTWIADYGMGPAAEIAMANLAEAPLDLTVKDPADKPYWGNVFKAAELSTGTLRLHGGGNVPELEGYDKGAWWVQDAAAAIPAMLFGPLAGTHVIDLCAAPGGKTMQLAAQGAQVTAVDRSAQRLKKLEGNLARLGMEAPVEIVVSDAAAWRPAEEPQRILVDAPCTATGTIRRNPDILHHKTARDMESLTALQTRILDNAADMLGEGGVLVYCTCSLQKAEGEHQIERLLAARDDIERVPIQKEEIGNYTDLINEQGDLRILPYHLATHGGMDGFFISRLTKTK